MQNEREKVCHIVGAADFVPARFSPEPGDLVIAADAGIRHLEAVGVSPDLVIGDFDSLGFVPELPNVERVPIKKDDTDSMLALRRAHELGFRRVLMHGCTGGERLDHSLANIQSLCWAAEHGIFAVLIGRGFCITAVKNGVLQFEKGVRCGLSVFAFGPPAKGVFLEGCQYGLFDATLRPDFSLGVSNSILGEGANVTVCDGVLTVYWSDDGKMPLPEPESGGCKPKNAELQCADP